MRQVLGIGIAFAGMASAAAAQGAGSERYYCHMWDGGHGMGYGLFGGGVMLLLLILAVVVTVLAMRGMAPMAGPGQKHDAALDILKARLARGEIDTEEYAARKKALES